MRGRDVLPSAAMMLSAASSTPMHALTLQTHTIAMKDLQA
jgi:hypothetical protein